MLASIMRRRDLDLPIRDRTTLSRRRADLTVVKTMSTASRPVNVMIGATGLTVFGADEWQRERRTEAGCHLEDGLVVLGLWRTGDLARGGSGTISRMLRELILDGCALL
jgi:hypothetical protein